MFERPIKKAAGSGAPEKGSGYQGNLNADDWRGPTAPVARAAASKQGRFGQANPLHLRAKRGTPAEERARAQSVVAVAKRVIEEAFADVRGGGKVDPAKVAPIVDAVMASVSRSSTALPSILRIKAVDQHSYLHAIAVCGLMVALAQELNFKLDAIRDLGLAGLLHDIGEAFRPPALQDEAGTPVPEDIEAMRAHAGRGHSALSEAGDLPEIVLEVALHHNERLDGSGYPFGLDEPDIGTAVRMAAICDVYDELTCPRDDVGRLAPAQAIERMRRMDREFDQKILASFVRTMGAFPTGSLVRLTSNRLAVVLDESEENLLKPAVVVFHCALTGTSVTPQRIASASDPIIGIELPERYGFKQWEKICGKLLEHSVR